jgi:steroid Delta-isomerase
MSVLERHVQLFNEAIRTGDFGPMLAHFTDDAELVFEGIPVGPFVGKQAIADAYAANPPDDEVEIISVEESENPLVAHYAWRADAGREAGRMIITPRGDEIARLVVTFE